MRSLQWFVLSNGAHPPRICCSTSALDTVSPQPIGLQARRHVALSAGGSLSQGFPWVCLLVVALTVAYGLQLAAATMVSPAVATDQVVTATSTRKVLIAAVDPVTGDRAQAECDAPSDNIASEVVLVDANDFPAIAQVCTVVNAPVVSPPSSL